MNDEHIQALPQADIEKLNVYFPNEDWSQLFWGFSCFSREKFANILSLLDCVDIVMLGVQCIDGSTMGELSICWHMLNGKAVPKLEAYDDAWQILQTPTFAAVMEELTPMSRDHAPTPDEVSAMLIAHGFTDESDSPLKINTEERYSGEK